MDDPLADYLHDHLAGSRLAVDLLEAMKSDYEGEALGRFAEELLRDVEADRSTLEDIIERVGSGSALTLKEGFAWAAEKLTWLKLRRMQGRKGALLSLETLAVGIHGKHALWKSLEALASHDERLAGFDFVRLGGRAEDQRGRVEVRRIEAALKLLESEG